MAGGAGIARWQVGTKVRTCRKKRVALRLGATQFRSLAGEHGEERRVLP